MHTYMCVETCGYLESAKNIRGCVAAVADTSLVWLISAITLALMAIPNLVSIFLLRKEIRLDSSDYRERLLSGKIRE